MSLNERLSKVLPKDNTYLVVHTQSTPRETHPVITPSSNATRFKTIKAEHFITLSHGGVIVFGIEIYTYITLNTLLDQTEVLLFVAKADTTGFNSTKVRIGLVTKEILSYLLNIPIEHYLSEIVPKLDYKPSPDAITKFTNTKEALKILLERNQGKKSTPPKIAKYCIKASERPSKIIHKVSFFTRAEQQYIFPYSGSNGRKHVLSGSQLLNWWVGIVDQVLMDDFKSNEKETLARLTIPGEDGLITRKYFNSLKFPHWAVGDIFHIEDPTSDIAVFKIPLYPDDPKGRFLEHLVVENRVKSVTSKQFWVELQVRQEFRLGVTVGVVGVEGQLKDHTKDSSNVDDLIVLPHREFKKCKDYITGEEYHDEDGAIDALANSLKFLQKKGYDGMGDTVGEWVKSVQKPAVEKHNIINVVPVNDLSGMVVRKKKKP
ncbi:hypothetical protein WICPIJ_002565 [Wickerhamomyces pijperi]|uniref:histone acetyltransferase n=1 Tax=Wickerhamomyces pijperi TaxID=599730 RepID=A0A9P8QBK5_WICPI|nr:hypothetical protein WICPIJ_002565 [Wickerhamomyces pijperi]